MALQTHVVVLLLLSCLFRSSYSYQFVVNWVPNPSENYNSLSQRLRFQINDSVLFKYKQGGDSVLEVSKDDYDKCNTNSPIKKMEDGNSMFTFDRSGPFYFISGNKDSCNKGQKIQIVVISVRKTTPPAPKTPAPAATPPATAPPSNGSSTPSPSAGSTTPPPKTSAPSASSPVAAPPKGSSTPTIPSPNGAPTSTPTGKTPTSSPTPAGSNVSPPSPATGGTPTISPAANAPSTNSPGSSSPAAGGPSGSIIAPTAGGPSAGGPSAGSLAPAGGPSAGTLAPAGGPSAGANAPAGGPSAGANAPGSPADINSPSGSPGNPNSFAVKAFTPSVVLVSAVSLVLTMALGDFIISP
ncbi:early nodulin-like protein 2 isoform X4 [Lycium ferocissimum]|uniref:early nodulin-like protein 2 isoform X4 n=1 Tax=Lycium ferocissimum TaxID=112874 RepID=UPI002814DFA6|nr:early nodulin-like protein 2 isoform X4 [Lycium ferocissimum]